MEEQNKYYENPLEEQEHVEVSDFLREDDWQNVDIDKNWLDPAERYKPLRYTLSYNGHPFAPLGGIHGLTGQAGHGKTFTFTQLMVAILRGEFYGLKYELSREIKNPKVLYIDTEMEKGNTQLVMLRVYEMMGWEVGSVHDEFKVLWLREEVYAIDRWRKTLKAIDTMKPTVVFLDGLIDVVGDFNDNKECQAIIYKCMATASYYDISMWCLLHENPGSSKMVGHAGSFLERKVTDVLKTKKNKEGNFVSFEVIQNKARAKDLDSWQFRIDDGANKYGCPVIMGEAEVVEVKPQPTLTEIVSVIGDDTICFSTLRERIKEKYNIGSGKAKEYIDEADKQGILIRKGNKYTMPHPLDEMLNNSEKLDDDGLPF